MSWSDSYGTGRSVSVISSVQVLSVILKSCIVMFGIGLTVGVRVVSVTVEMMSRV